MPPSCQTLSSRHAVIFGKASSCENPVLVDLLLNDREDFVDAFRQAHPIAPINPPGD